MKKTQLTSNINAILNSRFLLYFIFIVALVDLYVFAVSGELIHVAIFICIGYLTSFFSKNMMVILFVAIVGSNILRYGGNISLKEGLETLPDEEIPLSKSVSLDTTSKGNTNEGDDDQYLSNDNTTKKSKESMTSEKTPETKSVESDVLKKIAGLDKDSVDLLEKQKKLVENMENLKPLLQKTEAFLDKFKTLNG